ncbi:MAG: SsgA family sporulation/cell division regulator [Nocardioidaceae bacterium]
MKTNRTAAVAVTETMKARLVATHGGALELNVTLGYDSRDPFAVSAVMETSSLRITWVFARELLDGGLLEPTGDGDVHVWPCLDHHGHSILALELCSDDGDALLELPTQKVAGFVDNTLAAVPAGTEADHLDVDALLESIFGA